MSFSLLTYGEPDHVVDWLDGHEATPDELRAALINAMKRISQLETNSHAPIDQNEIFRRLEILEQIQARSAPETGDKP